uniref:Uncharacterized protein n=1 Tax=Romanomermis culicivorax TaxID=13658 RepID=A0A915HNN2_ROMCU
MDNTARLQSNKVGLDGQGMLGTLLLASCDGKSTFKSRNWMTSCADICMEVEHHKEKKVMSRYFLSG